MGWFKKKDEVLDLTEYYNKRKSEMSGKKDTIDLTPDNTVPEATSDSENKGGFFGSFFGTTNVNPTNNTQEENSNENTPDVYERRKKLANRLKNMTDKLEDISNQIYHVQQRIELLEKKINLNN